MGFHADVPEAGPGTHRVPGRGLGSSGETCAGSEGSGRHLRSGPAPRSERFRGSAETGGGGGSIMVGEAGAEAGAEPGRGPGASLGGCLCLPGPRGLLRPGRGGPGSPQAQALPRGARVKARPRCGPRGLRGWQHPARFGSVRCVLGCVGVLGQARVCAGRARRSRPSPPAPGRERCGSRRCLQGASLEVTAPSHCGGGRTFPRSALCQGNARGETSIAYGCQGTSLKLESVRKKGLVLDV